MSLTPPPAPRSHPTMLDVARLAGVSVKTASRVLNDEPHVAAATADKVTRAAGQLGFRPNSIARDLRRGARSTAIGLIIGDVGNPFYARLTRGVERRLRQEGLQLITASSDEDPEQERRLTTEMIDRRVCGLLLTSCLPHHRHLESSRVLGTPIVFLDRPPLGLAADTVAIDNEGGARLAARHLLEQGHRRVGLIGDLSRLPTHRERVRGFELALTESGIDDWQRYVRVDTHDTDSAGQALRELLALDEPPTALFTTNNRITIGAVRALRGNPAPPALVGFDDFELADVLDVTVISHHPEDMGALGAEHVLGRMRGAEDGVHCSRLPVRLIERGSGERPPP